MLLIERLYLIFVCVLVINALTSIINFWPRYRKSEPLDKKTVWSWRDTIWLIIMLLALTLFCIFSVVLAPQLKGKWVSGVFIIILYQPYLSHVSGVFSNAEILGGIVKNNDPGHLSKKEHFAVLSLGILLSFLHRFVTLDSVRLFAESHVDGVTADWIVIIFYVFSVSSFIFFICSLIVSPLQWMIKLFKKIGRFLPLQRIKDFVTKVEKKHKDQMPTKTLTVFLIEHRFKCCIVFRLLLWIIVIPAILLDAFRMAVLLVVEIFFSVIWYAYLLIKQIVRVLIRLMSWILTLSDKRIVAISFRVAIILGLGITVIFNMYSPFLYTREASKTALEFIASAIIIPIIIEWILSYNKRRTE